MKSNYFKLFSTIVAAILFSGVSAYASVPTVSQVPGRVMWVDVKLGQMQIKLDKSTSNKEKKEYRITRNETRVKAPLDKKFLTIDDLRPGEKVTLDVVNGQEDGIIERIVAEALDASDFQEASGQIQVIDSQQGTLTLQENMKNGVEVKSNPSDFVFDPNAIVVLQSPNIQPVELILKPGDQVKIQYVLKDGKQQAYSITLYPSQHTTTTVVTTTTSIQ